jgi:hypothetical protein
VRGIGISIGMGEVEVGGKRAASSMVAAATADSAATAAVQRWEKRLRGGRERRGKGKQGRCKEGAESKAELTKRFAR